MMLVVVVVVRILGVTYQHYVDGINMCLVCMCRLSATVFVCRSGATHVVVGIPVVADISEELLRVL